MDMPEVKSFNAELSGLYDNKPPISKAKMSAITRGAIKAIKFYKHVVHSVEKFIQKCKPEYKVPGLYVIDSIVRQSRHQFGQDKDVFAPRFAKNMQQTFANLFRCPPEDKRNIIRVLNLWQKNHVFGPEVIQPLLDMADPNHPLHLEIQQQQNNTANGSSLNLTHNTTDSKISPVPPPQHTPHASTPMGDQFQDQPSGPPPGVKFNRKLLNDFEYESEDDMIGTEPPPSASHTSHSTHSTHTTHSGHASHPTHSSHQGYSSHQSHQTHPTHQSHNPTDALGSILTNPEIMRQLQSLQAQMQMMTGMQIPNLMPMMSDMQLQQPSNPGLPFLNSQQDPQKANEPKEDMANESDIEFVETGPQVIEIPDANDSRRAEREVCSRSPSPKSRRHRSRSKSPKRRRRSRSRSRDRRRDRDRDRDRDREKSHKEREAEKEKQREREKKGLPPIKKENLSVCSTTLWVGHLSKLATPEELSDLFGAFGGVQAIDVVAPRGCAFVVMERRRDAAKALAKLNRHKLHSKEITVAWAAGKGVKGREWKDYWEADLGVAYLPWDALQQRWALGALSLDALEDGGAVDEDTLPPWLPPRIIPKAMMEGMPMMGAMPPVSMPGPLPLSAPMGAPPPAPLAAPLPARAAPPPTAMPVGVPRMPPPGMTTGIPPGFAPGMPPGMPPGIRPPSIPTGVPGLQRDGPLLGFPGGMPPQSLPQPGMVGGFLSGLVGGLVLPLHHQPPPHHQHPQQHQPQHQHQQQHQPQHQPQHQHHQLQQITASAAGGGASVPADDPVATDDAMELDPDDSHADAREPALLPEQIQALLSKPPPNFKSTEPPPKFTAEAPPFDASQPPPADDKRDDERRDRDRDKERRDRDRERRDRDRDRDRDRRDRDRDRGRDRADRAPRDRDRERDERRDRDRDRGRDRRDRDRDRDRERDRPNNKDSNNSRERSREKSPRTSNAGGAEGEKSLQERLWEMANGALERRDAPDAAPPERAQPEPGAESVADGEAVGAAGPGTTDTGTTGLETAGPGATGPGASGPGVSGPGVAGPGAAGSGGPGWPPRFVPPPFRAGPWMEIQGPPFGPRFNGMGPPPFNRPPFERPPFEGGPMFDGPPRFERPPFNRMPFDMNRPPFDGMRMPFDGPRPPFDGTRPPFDGTRPPFDGTRPPFDGSRPPFDGTRPPFDGSRPPFDGPRPPFNGPRPPFDGPRPPFDGPRPPFDGSRPPFDGPRPPFDGTRPPFDGPRPPFEGPPRQFEGERPFDESRFDGPSEFFDRNNRRFEEREQFNERGWNGDREMDREWDRRSEYDDRRRERRGREHEDRNRDRGDRRRNNDERPRQSRDERTPRRDKDRKSRWGAADENIPSEEQENVQEVRPEIENQDVSKDIQEPEETSQKEQTVHNNDYNEDMIGESLQLEAAEIRDPIDRRTELEPQESDNDETSYSNDNNEHYKAREENEPLGGTNELKVSDLYDASDAVDTSFSMAPAVENNIEPLAAQEERVTETPESTKSIDIFNSEVESYTQNQTIKEVQNTENKEGLA